MDLIELVRGVPDCAANPSQVAVLARQADAATARYAAHSLRAGFITTSAANGEPIHKIMEQTGHVRYETVAGYIRNARAIKESAAGRLGL